MRTRTFRYLSVSLLRKDCLIEKIGANFSSSNRESIAINIFIFSIQHLSIIKKTGNGKTVNYKILSWCSNKRTNIKINYGISLEKWYFDFGSLFLSSAKSHWSASTRSTLEGKRTSSQDKDILNRRLWCIVLFSARFQICNKIIFAETHFNDGWLTAQQKLCLPSTRNLESVCAHCYVKTSRLQRVLHREISYHTQ